MAIESVFQVSIYTVAHFTILRLFTDMFFLRYRSLRVSDPLMKRRIVIANLYRKYDMLSQGSIKYFQFHEIWQELLDMNYINTTKKYKPEDIIERVDTLKRNRVEMNRFIDWLDAYVGIPIVSASKWFVILLTAVLVFIFVCSQLQ